MLLDHRATIPEVDHLAPRACIRRSCNRYRQMEREPPSSSRLLELPAELRNRIYCYAVVSDTSVPVGANSFSEPALLATSKQIRDEASPVFYAENSFNVDMSDYETTLYLLFRRKQIAIFKRYGVKTKCHPTGTWRPNWQNLHTWLRLLHVGLIFKNVAVRPSSNPAMNILDKTWNSLFETVESLRDLPWSRVEDIVEQHHMILVAIDPSWA